MTTPPPLDPRLQAARDAIVGRPVPWDELRSRRVLSTIERRLDAPGGTPSPSPGRGLTVGLACAAVILAATMIFWVVRTPMPSPGTMAAVVERSVDPPRPKIPFAPPPVLTLADGSTAQLSDGAQIELLHQSAAQIELSQRGGRVRYEVTPNPARRFVVSASGVEVSVLGTIFTVGAIGSTHVEVSVERGLVQVASADRVSRLGPGDSLRVEAESDEIVILDDPEPVTVRRRHADPGREPKDNEDADGGPSLEALLAASDRARAEGALAEAAAALRTLVRRFPDNAQGVSAYFQLGKVERQRGRHAAAARAFAACVLRSPRGTLAEDARAEAAVSYATAGLSTKAHLAAENYLRAHPSGAHAARMQRIVDGTP